MTCACAISQIVACPDNTFAAERVEVLLRETTQLGVRTRAQCLAYLGKHFRAVRAGCVHTTRMCVTVVQI